MGGTIYKNHTLEHFKELGLDSLRVKKHASKLHVHFDNYAAKLVHTRRALSSTIINSHQETVSGQACNPPDPHSIFLFPLVEEFYGTRYQSGSFSLRWGVVFHCLRSFSFFLTEIVLKYMGCCVFLHPYGWCRTQNITIS